MELGGKLKQARLDAGLSQRQLCGDVITRNMLSQIENGAARPSMDTLRYLASQLGRPESYFLEEDGLFTPNQKIMDRARQAHDIRDFPELERILTQYQSPDPVYEPEYRLLRRLSILAGAEQALVNGKNLLAARMLEEMGEIRDGYCSQELERRRLLLLGKAQPRFLGVICEKLPSLDEELMLRAEDALERGELDRSGYLLEAVQDRDNPQWHLLRGQTHLAKREYEQAVEHFLAVEETAVDKLELCYRELGNFERAYYYACKQRKK